VQLKFRLSQVKITQRTILACELGVNRVVIRLARGYDPKLLQCFPVLPKSPESSTQGTMRFQRRALGIHGFAEMLRGFRRLIQAQEYFAES
jgi:hypothetical protein